MKKQENESSDKVLEAVSVCLVRQVSISQMSALIVHIVLAELIVRFTTFRHHTMF